MRYHKEIEKLYAGSEVINTYEKIVPGLGPCDASLVGRPALYKCNYSFDCFEKGKEYECIVLFGSPEGNTEGGIDPMFVCEFPDGAVRTIYVGHVRFTDVAPQDMDRT